VDSEDWSRLTCSERLSLLGRQRELQDDWTVQGLGRVEDGTNEAYFLVVEWASAQALRAKLGLPPHDFHITVGFKYVEHRSNELRLP